VEQSRTAADRVRLVSIDRREISPQSILFVRRRCTREQLPQHIGECLGAAFAYALQSGSTVVGVPFVRYSEIRPDGFTIEGGCPVAAPAAGAGEVEAGTLQGGAAAVALHAGGYDDLAAAHGALERWIADNGYRAAGAPWESYLTDPGQYPDMTDWRTEIVWPIAKA
jgi:AraC family transcriptional regulator